VQTPSQPTGPPPIRPPDVTLRTITLVRWGTLAWLLALVALLVSGVYREGDRGWWVWVPVAGALLGALGHAYLARGKGNAAEA
jgi:hypothetical protein